jgi:apurinic endonuclease APN1
MNLFYSLSINYKMSDTTVIFSSYPIGSHLSYINSASNTIDKAIAIGLHNVQFFLGSPQSLNRTTLTEKDIDGVLKISKKFPINIFTHFPYIANLAGCKDTLAWNGDDLQDEKTLKTIYSLQGELEQVAKFNGKGVVLHPGCFPDSKKACASIAKSINKINFTEGSNLILENMAGQGSMIGSTFEELVMIRNLVDKEKKKHISFCIDTAHIWGKGLYNLSQTEGIDKMFVDIDDKLGWENVSLFHFNDSKVKLGSKVDRHELLGDGEIFSGREEVIKYFLDKAIDKNIPCVLETHPGDSLKIFKLYS